MHQLYTYGYLGGGRLSDLRAYANGGALILDVRYRPRSRNPQWNGIMLHQHLGSGYEWCQALGNVNYRNGGPIQLQNGQAGLDLLAQRLERQPVVLLCACADWRACHRKVVAELAVREIPGVGDVQHLRPEEALG